MQRLLAERTIYAPVLGAGLSQRCRAAGRRIRVRPNAGLCLHHTLRGHHAEGRVTRGREMMHENLLDQRSAPFETAAPRPPQGEDISKCNHGYLMLRSARREPLEARATSMRSFAPLVR